MHKILLILKREYLTRVRKRTFIISTILLPLLYLGMIFGTAYIGAKGNTRLNVAILDSSGYFDKGRIERANQSDSSTIMTYVDTQPDSLKANFKKMGYDGYIIIPQQTSPHSGASRVLLQTDKTLSNEGANPVQNKLNNMWNGIKNEKLGISDSIKTMIETSYITVRPRNIKDEKANSSVASGIGFTAGILIYIILLLYGSQVMMGVMEEKTSRIAEVIVSSVKPFQLMVGKIVGIGLVALTQFLLWIVFVLIIYNVTKASGTGTAMDGVIGNMQNIFTSINVPLIVFCFGFYLLAGFFFYASLYAAIGSAVNEDMREAQSLSFPITMLVIFSFAIMSAAMKDPTGSLAVWGSIIPFSSPIVMMARVAFGVPTTVPWWQLGLSMVTLVAGFMFTAWFAGRIYRTGILMYGKKPTWKELLKWAIRKQ